ncbi:MAG TPA: hypothetical protein VKA70_12285 [Blastocatellia bacterium]|nr:hypothetical protein [Blastocatellia bacterium]
MPAMTRRRTAELIRKVFEIVLPHPDGLPSDAVIRRIQQTLVGNGTLSSAYANQFDETAHTVTIAPIRAGWLVNEEDRWMVTERGRRAFDQFHDPEEFLREAARQSLRGWASANFPRFYARAGRLKEQMVAEYRVARRVGLRRLMTRAIGATRPWQEVLPRQAPRRFKIGGAGFNTVGELMNHLDSIGAKYSKGGHTVYLPPDSARRSIFKDVMKNYPADAGIKIVKNQGGLDDGAYSRDGLDKADSLIRQKLLHGHRHLSLVANLFFAKGLGPRLYDLIEIESGERVWTAYVTEHVEGRVPEQAECEAGIERIREMERQGLIKVSLPLGFLDKEFEPPACMNNALVDPSGNFHYIDFQNFLLMNYDGFLKETAIAAAERSHFGDRSLLRGGRYLYQSVPGVAIAGKRAVAERIEVINGLMQSAGVTVKDRLVLDVGCNIGMMMEEYLGLGAAWCHGWDRAHITPHTEALLLALGCTRFSTTGGDIAQEQDVEADLPEFIRAALNGCVISYLAVRAHIGWLDALGRIQWSFMIYEGHEGESESDFQKHVAEFRKLVSFKVAASTRYKDGDCDERTLAILVRE